MSEPRITRRFLLGGTAALAAGTASYRASAILPALLSGIRNLVTLWNGYKMADEVYHKFFAGDEANKHISELKGFFGSKSVEIENFYRFGNPYNLPNLRDIEFGCSTSQSLSCGTPAMPVLLPVGFVVAVDYAARDLQSSFGAEKAFQYTRPMQRVKRAERWDDVNDSGRYFKSEMQYYSPRGSVGLRWLITDPKNRISYAEFNIRDDDSGRIVTEGRTPEFSFS